MTDAEIRAAHGLDPVDDSATIPPTDSDAAIRTAHGLDPVSPTPAPASVPVGTDPIQPTNDDTGFWSRFLPSGTYDHSKTTKAEKTPVGDAGPGQAFGYAGGLTSTYGMDILKRLAGNATVTPNYPATLPGVVAQGAQKLVKLFHPDDQKPVSPQDWQDAVAGNAKGVPAHLQDMGVNKPLSWIMGLPAQVGSDPFAGAMGGAQYERQILPELSDLAEQATKDIAPKIGPSAAKESLENAPVMSEFDPRIKDMVGNGDKLAPVSQPMDPIAALKRQLAVSVPFSDTILKKLTGAAGQSGAALPFGQAVNNKIEDAGSAIFNNTKMVRDGERALQRAKDAGNLEEGTAGDYLESLGLSGSNKNISDKLAENPKIIGTKMQNILEKGGNNAKFEIAPGFEKETILSQAAQKGMTGDDLTQAINDAGMPPEAQGSRKDASSWLNDEKSQVQQEAQGDVAAHRQAQADIRSSATETDNAISENISKVQKQAKSDAASYTAQTKQAQNDLKAMQKARDASSKTPELAQEQANLKQMQKVQAKLPPEMASAVDDAIFQQQHKIQSMTDQAAMPHDQAIAAQQSKIDQLGQQAQQTAVQHQSRLEDLNTTHDQVMASHNFRSKSLSDQHALNMANHERNFDNLSDLADVFDADPYEHVKSLINSDDPAVRAQGVNLLRRAMPPQAGHMLDMAESKMMDAGTVDGVQHFLSGLLYDIKQGPRTLVQAGNWKTSLQDLAAGNENMGKDAYSRYVKNTDTKELAKSLAGAAGDAMEDHILSQVDKNPEFAEYPELKRQYHIAMRVSKPAARAAEQAMARPPASKLDLIGGGGVGALLMAGEIKKALAALAVGAVVKTGSEAHQNAAFGVKLSNAVKSLGQSNVPDNIWQMVIHGGQNKGNQQ